MSIVIWMDHIPQFNVKMTSINAFNNISVSKHFMKKKTLIDVWIINSDPFLTDAIVWIRVEENIQKHPWIGMMIILREHSNAVSINLDFEVQFYNRFSLMGKIFSISLACVRNQDLIRQITKRDKITEIFSKYHCDQNGNYLPLQCSTTECYCVDPITGFAVTDGSLKTEKKIIKSFKCYLNYPNKQLLDLLIDI